MPVTEQEGTASNILEAQKTPKVKSSEGVKLCFQ